MPKNPKAEGEKGEAITIGELAKWDIQVALPMSDNLPIDLVLFYNNKLWKAQVKSCGQITTTNSTGSVPFDLTTSNWYKKTTKKYLSDEIDIMLLCDYENVYILGPEDFNNRSGFSIRKTKPKNNQSKGINMAEDYILSQERIDKVLA